MGLLWNIFAVIAGVGILISEALLVFTVLAFLAQLSLCQRQLNSEHFRQSKIDPITVDGCFAKLELTHLLVIAQGQCQQLSAPLFRQRSGLWELSLALREDTAGKGTILLAASP